MADYAQLTDADATWRDGGTTSEATLIVAVQGTVLVDVRSVAPTVPDAGVPLVANTGRDALELSTGLRWWYRRPAGQGSGQSVINRIAV